MWPFDSLPAIPGAPGLPSPGGFPGLPSPGAWPGGVPNPLGLPSPGDMASTIGGWFSNPYGTNGTQGSQAYGGINPFDTRFSQPAWDPGRPTPWGSSPGDTSLGNSQNGFAPLSQLGQRGGGPVNPVTLQQPRQQRTTPFQVHETGPAPITGGHMGGGNFGTGIFGPQWLYHQGGGQNAPWQHVQPGSSVYGKGG